MRTGRSLGMIGHQVVGRCRKVLGLASRLNFATVGSFTNALRSLQKVSGVHEPICRNSKTVHSV